MRFYVLAVGFVFGLATAGCAKGDKVAETTGKDEPQARMNAKDLEQLMQTIGPTYQSLRKNLQSNETAEAGKQAQQLAELFGGVEKFWTQHNRPDAVKWAGEARTFASDVAGTAVAGSADKAAKIAETMGGVCKQCHGTYRESDGEGGYRIKPGVIQ